MILINQYEINQRGRQIPEEYIYRNMWQRLADFVSKYYTPTKETRSDYMGGSVDRYTIRLMVTDEKDYLNLRRSIAEAVEGSALLHGGEKSIAKIMLGKVFDEFEKKQEIIPVK